MHKRGGPRSHPGMVSPGWELITLRLLWNSSRDGTLHQGCGRVQCRRCLRILSQRVASGSPGCACAFSGRGTGLTPGPGSMATMARSSDTRQRCWCRQEVGVTAGKMLLGELKRADDEDGSDVRAGRDTGHAGVTVGSR